MTDALKPVLVVDNRELYAPTGEHAEFVREMPVADVAMMDPADWAAVFVHDDNVAELNWVRQHAREHFGGVYFKFTGRNGEFGNLTVHRGAYKLPRWLFEERFADYLAAYTARGVADAETARIFEVP